MRFGLVHRIMTDALAALGVFALVASGQFDRTVDIIAVVGLGAAVAMKEAWRHEAARRHLDTIAVFALIAAQLGRLVLTKTSGLDLLIEFAVGLQIIRVATRKGAAHDQQVIVLALLHLIAGTVVGGGLGYGLCFVGLLVVTPGALVLSHLRREVEGNYRQGARDRTGLPVDVPRILRSKRVVGRQFIAVTCLLSVPILVFTVVLFIVFPRVGLSLLLLNRPQSDRMVGFSGKVDLGQFGTLRTNPTIALRVVYPPQEAPPARRVMHLRGTALDHYDGKSWSQTASSLRTVATGADLVPLGREDRRRVDPATDASIRIELEPIDPPVLFFPSHAGGFRLQPSGIGPNATVSVQRGPEHEFRYQAPGDRGVHYTVYLGEKGRPVFTSLRESERYRYLQLPALPPRLGQLAASWADGGNDDFAVARAIERRLRTDFRYDLASPSGAEDQPLDHFLFESQRGHCEFFSTAMAVMLRTQGIPSRNVTGFVGGTYNKFGRFYAVRQGDAHSWVEAFIEGRGWVTFDPTPPGAATPQSEVEGWLASVRDFFEAISQRWDRHVLGYDLQQQVGLLDRMGRRSPALSRLTRPRARDLWVLAGVLLVGVGLYFWRQQRRRARPASDDEPRRPSRQGALAASLYQQLDRAMVAMGIARPATVPPMRHAARLRHEDHPDSAVIIDLTRRYLDARFGDVSLDAEARRAFERAVRGLVEAHQQRHPPRGPLARLAATPMKTAPGGDEEGGDDDASAVTPPSGRGPEDSGERTIP